VIPLERALAQVFATLDQVAVAVSGGVDSMTLAHLTPIVIMERRARMVHAVSPAVPAEATARVRAHADRYGWALALIDAGEFADSRYSRRSLLFDPLSRTAVLDHGVPAAVPAKVGVVCAGTSDMGVAVEAQRGLAFHGVSAMVIGDVGVAGLWRLFDRLDEIASWRVRSLSRGWRELCSA
jgi:NCAIR mutase (PurE)-related protein